MIPRGVSGSRLAFEAYQQAWSFGTTFLFMRQVEGLTADEVWRLKQNSDRAAQTLNAENNRDRVLSLIERVIRDRRQDRDLSGMASEGP